MDEWGVAVTLYPSSTDFTSESYAAWAGCVALVGVL